MKWEKIGDRRRKKIASLLSVDAMNLSKRGLWDDFFFRKLRDAKFCVSTMCIVVREDDKLYINSFLKYVVNCYLDGDVLGIDIPMQFVGCDECGNDAS